MVRPGMVSAAAILLGGEPSAGNAPLVRLSETRRLDRETTRPREVYNRCTLFLRLEDLTFPS